MDRELEQLIWDRAAGRCEYCQMPFGDWLPFQVDHIIAEKHHGQTEEANLALSCFHCNSFKGPNVAGFDPLTGRLVRLFHPRRDRWHKHFDWNDVLLVGQSPVGRATIDVLRINHPRLIQLRRSIRDEGLI